jgi:hypothetical protein
MGMKEAFKAAAQTAFSAAGNVKKSVTYRSKSNKNPTYTPSTNTVTDRYTDYTVNMIFESYISREIDNRTVLATDQKALIPVDNLTPTPKINDEVIVDKGETTEVNWDIVHIHKDPADALYTFQIRKP